MPYFQSEDTQVGWKFGCANPPFLPSLYSVKVLQSIFGQTVCVVIRLLLRSISLWTTVTRGMTGIQKFYYHNNVRWDCILKLITASDNRSRKLNKIMTPTDHLS